METTPLDKLQDRDLFDCEVEPLNDYLKKYALQNQKKDAARTYVLADEENQVIGYYTLVFGSVAIEETTPEISAGLGKYPIPVILLARLAIDKNQKGKGLVSLIFPVEKGEREVELELPGRYAVTPALKGAIKIVHGVREVEEV